MPEAMPTPTTPDSFMQTFQFEGGCALIEVKTHTRHTATKGGEHVAVDLTLENPKNPDRPHHFKTLSLPSNLHIDGHRHPGVESALVILSRMEEVSSFIRERLATAA